MAECVDETELQELRLKINSRERRRMHDLNSALDEVSSFPQESYLTSIYNFWQATM
jgi:class B basic helix-loop-helix protein 1/6/7